MNLGIGPLELLTILLVAFIFLGPERLVDAAKLLGKTVREVRRMTADLPQIDLDDEESSTDKTTSNHNTVDYSAPEDPNTEGDRPIAFEPYEKSFDDNQGETSPKDEEEKKKT